MTKEQIEYEIKHHKNEIKIRTQLLKYQDIIKDTIQKEMKQNYKGIIKYKKILKKMKGKK